LEDRRQWIRFLSLAESVLQGQPSPRLVAQVLMLAKRHGIDWRRLYSLIYQARLYSEGEGCRLPTPQEILPYVSG